MDLFEELHAFALQARDGGVEVRRCSPPSGRPACRAC
jgi:hypothetical protein